jgi:hypothetical protein
MSRRALVRMLKRCFGACGPRQAFFHDHAYKSSSGSIDAGQDSGGGAIIGPEVPLGSI